MRAVSRIVARPSTRSSTEAAPEGPTLVVHAPWGVMRRLLAEDPSFTQAPARGQVTEAAA